MYISIYICICTFIRNCTCYYAVCAYRYILIFMLIYIHIYTSTYIHTFIHTYMRMCH